MASLMPHSYGSSSRSELSVMDEDDISMPATPPDIASIASSQIKLLPTPNTLFQAKKRQDYFLSVVNPSRPRLILSPEDKTLFVNQIEASKKKFLSDTAFLPKSTNMGLSDVDAAALLSVNPYNFSGHNPQSWEDNDVDVDRGSSRSSSRNGKTVFVNAFPCLYVSNLANSIAFYQKIIGFTPVGKPANHQAVMRRGPAARPPRGGNRAYSAIPSAAEEEGVRIILRYLPPEWGELNGDGSGPPQLLVVVSNTDELFQEIFVKQQQFRPKGSEYFPEIFLGKAKVLARPQNKPWGTREMHVLDPDGNKIIFYHELEH